MKRLVIAIDCDEVLISGAAYIVDTYNRQYGTNVQPEHAHMSNNPEWKADRAAVLHRIYEIQRSAGYAELVPIQRATQVVKRLAATHELHMITARPTEIMEVTHKMLDRYFPGCFTSVEHIGPDLSKGEMCQRLRADVMIDDTLKHLESAQHCGVAHRVLFGEGSRSHVEVDSPVTAICADWDAVEVEIERISR